MRAGQQKQHLQDYYQGCFEFEELIENYLVNLATIIHIKAL